MEKGNAYNFSPMFELVERAHGALRMVEWVDQDVRRWEGFRGVICVL